MFKKGFSVRNKRVIKMINLDNQIGLELGPLTSPVVKRDQGHIYYLDHMTQEELKEKYKNEPVYPDEIVPIDFTLKGGDIRRAVKGKKFDYIIASHVIEHVPDTISWLKDISSVLKTGGVLSLVIPDKRFTFDLLRKDTMPNEVIGAYIDKMIKPSSSMMYDFASHNAIGIDVASVWDNKELLCKRSPKFRWTKQEALDMCKISASSKAYIDCHCYVYTPESFLTIIKELTGLNLIDFEICNFMETQKYESEFFVSFRKTIINDKNKNSIINKIPKKKSINNEKQLKKLHEDIRKLQTEIELLTNSSSWKITKPLRYINKFRKQT